MKKIALTFITFIVLATFGVQAQGSDTGEIWRCFDPYDSGKNKVLVELTRARNLISIEEVFEELKKYAAAGTEELFEKGIKNLREQPDTPENRRTEESLLERYNATRPGQVSVAGVTHKASFRIEGLDRRWYFGWDVLEDRLEDLGKGSDFEDLAKVMEDVIKANYAFIIRPDGWGGYYDLSLLEYGETRTKPSQIFKCVLSRSLSSAELSRWDSPQGQPRSEKDLQKRPGRERTADGWVYELE